MTRPTLTPGDEVGGYRIVSAVGSGANGAVYRAVDGGGHEVALKILHAVGGPDDAARARLAREATTLRRLDHPAVADVLDVELDGEAPFIVTELVDGRSLEDEVAVRGPYHAEQLADLAEELHDALLAVHGAGVVHRDLKPSNIMVTPRGPVLIDFGIAHGVEDARMTSEGLVMGTPGYLAPEMLTGAAPSRATDWWGWAASLAFAATGRAPFGISPVDAVLARAQAGAADLRGLGERRARALSGALRADPTRRWEPETVTRELRAAADDGDALPDEDVGATEPAADAATSVLGTGAALAAAAPTAVVAASPVVSAGTAAVNDGHTRVLPVFVSPQPPDGPEAAGLADTAPQPSPADDDTMWIDDLEVPDDTPGYERPDHRRRATVLLALLLPLLAAATTWPVLAFGALAVLVVLARDVGVASDALHTRRERKGVARSDGWVVGVAAPWHLLRAVAGALPAVLVGGCVGLLLVVGAWWYLGDHVLADDPGVVGEQNVWWVYTAALAVAMLAAALCTWFGPAGRRARTGARTALAHVLPGRWPAVVVVVLAVAGAVLLALPALRGTAIEWWPFPGPPDLG